MSDINFCNTKEQLNHLGEVVTGKVDGSPTGADIDTSTLPYTGQVRRTLPALEGEYEQSITNKEIEADAAIDSYRLLNKGPYASGITLESKFEYITYNGESYFSTNPPYTTTATTPDADANLFLGGYTTLETVADKIGNPNLLANHNFLTPSPEVITHPSETSTTYTAGTQIFSGVYAGSSGVTITLINGRVNCSAGSYEYRAPNTNGLDRVPVFTSSVSDYDGNPVTTGVSHALVSNEYVVTVTPAAGDVFSVKFEQGSLATKHQVFGWSQLQAWKGVGDVRGWGASGDGVTDDSQAIQNAINESYHKALYLPAGTYIVETGLVITDSITISGDGNLTTVTIPDSGYGNNPGGTMPPGVYELIDIFRIEDCNNVIFKDFQIDGTMDSAPVGVFASGINNWDWKGAYHLVRHVLTSDFGLGGVTYQNMTFKGSFYNTQQLGVSGDVFLNEDGFYTRNRQINMSWLNCKFYNIGFHGVGLRDTYYGVVDGCYFENMGWSGPTPDPAPIFGGGLAVDVSAGGGFCRVVNNTVRNCTGAFKSETHPDQELPDGSLVEVVSHNNIFDNNNISNDKNYTPSLTPSYYTIKNSGTNVTISNNTIRRGNRYGIYTESKSTGTVIANNVIQDMFNPIDTNDTAGIFAETDSVITGNNISNCGNIGIAILGDDIVVSDNKVYQNAGTGISVRAASNRSNIKGNTVYNNGNNIIVEGVDSTVTENVCYDNGSGIGPTPTYGIYVLSSAIRCYYRDNRCFDNATNYRYDSPSVDGRMRIRCNFNGSAWVIDSAYNNFGLLASDFSTSGNTTILDLSRFNRTQRPIVSMQISNNFPDANYTLTGYSTSATEWRFWFIDNTTGALATLSSGFAFILEVAEDNI